MKSDPWKMSAYFLFNTYNQWNIKTTYYQSLISLLCNYLDVPLFVNMTLDVCTPQKKTHKNAVLRFFVAKFSSLSLSQTTSTCLSKNDFSLGCLLCSWTLTLMNQRGMISGELTHWETNVIIKMWVWKGPGSVFELQQSIVRPWERHGPCTCANSV